MAFASKLKDMMLFNAGRSYIGQVSTVTLPKLTRKLEEWRGAGMDMPIKVDMGGEAMDLEFTCGGPMRDVLEQFGVMKASAGMLRFAGAYQDDSTGKTTAVEVTARGRYEEIDMGDAKIGEDTEFKAKMSLSYYRLDWNGVPVIEIDTINMVMIVNGVDRLADRRAALGI